MHVGNRYHQIIICQIHTYTYMHIHAHTYLCIKNLNRKNINAIHTKKYIQYWNTYNIHARTFTLLYIHAHTILINVVWMLPEIALNAMSVCGLYVSVLYVKNGEHVCMCWYEHVLCLSIWMCMYWSVCVFIVCMCKNVKNEANYHQISLSVRASVGSVGDTVTCHFVHRYLSPYIFHSSFKSTRSWPGKAFLFTSTSWKK